MIVNVEANKLVISSDCEYVADGCRAASRAIGICARYISLLQTDSNKLCLLKLIRTIIKNSTASSAESIHLPKIN